MSRPAKALIDRAALRHNLSVVRRQAPASRILAVVKTDAYGHGIVRVARALDGADGFGVVSLDEAAQLRQAGIRQKILLLEGPYAAAELPEIARLQLDIVIHTHEQLAFLQAAAPPGAAFNIWLKVDTGMHRLGFSPEAFAELMPQLDCYQDHIRRLYLMSHLATANEPGSRLAAAQIQRFAALTRPFDYERSLANSAAVLCWPDSLHDWVRPGLILYGVSAVEGRGADHGLRPVMTLQSELIAVKQLRQGEPVGYGASWRCPVDMPVGIVAAGYGDGFPRHAGSGTPILVNGVRCSVVGNASMDMLTVDLRQCPTARHGAQVVLWGAGLPLEELAQHAGTIPYEILCSVNKRLEFVEQ